MDRPGSPVVFFAFADDRGDPTRLLRNLPEEKRRVREAMAVAQEAGLCEVVIRSNATVAEVFDVFQDSRYRDRIAIFHFSGHAGTSEIMLETPSGGPERVHAGALAAFLGQQRGLELVFLNGCSTAGQVQRLLDAKVPAVVATSRAIGDDAAMELADRFYHSLASGAPLRTAFNEAEAVVRSRLDDDPRRAYQRSASDLRDDWPWGLHVAPGAEEHVTHWSLPRAVDNPLYGLPELPEADLPLSPFKHLRAFTRDDAPVFFGRGHEIRTLFEALTADADAPIVLLCGASGVGKSSLLDAGLRPRLGAIREVVYRRRDGDTGLAPTLAEALGATAAETPAEAWRRRETDGGRPLIVILDQVEEAYTRPIRDGSDEVAALVEALRSIFAVRDERPRGRLLLSFREEWLAEVQARLQTEQLWYGGVVRIHHLGHDGILSAITGPASTQALRRQYQLEIESELPDLVAGDLLRDRERGATIAPALQILLTKMWTCQKATPPKRFTVELYERFRRHGILLEDFVGEQLEELRRWRPEMSESGLVLDVLAHHTTVAGTAETRRAEEVAARYGGRPEVVELLQKLKDGYLLSGSARIHDGELVPDVGDPDDLGTTRLAHDTLAPIVRRLYEESDRPGQRAARILEQRAVDWAEGRDGTALDKADLGVVERGEGGMRRWTKDEERLIDVSRQERARRKRVQVISWSLAAVAVLAIAVSAVLAWRKTLQAQEEKQRAEDRARVGTAGNLIADHESTWANLIMLEVLNLIETPNAEAMLHKVLKEYLDRPLPIKGQDGTAYHVAIAPDGSRVVTTFNDGNVQISDIDTGEVITTLRGHEEAVSAVEFSPDGTRLATASCDQTVRVWETETGIPISVLKKHIGSQWSISFSHDNSRIATVASNPPAQKDAQGNFQRDGQGYLLRSEEGFNVRVWDVEKAELISILRGHSAEVQKVLFSPGGTRIATASSDHTARLWDSTDGTIIFNMNRHSGGVQTLAFSPSGSLIATGSGDHSARIWDAKSGEEHTVLSGHSKDVGHIDFDPTGNRIATASGATAYIWSTSDGKKLTNLEGHTDEITSIKFSSDGKWIVTTALDETMRVWDSSAGQQTIAFRTDEASSAVFDRSGLKVISTNFSSAQIWSLVVGSEIATLRHPPATIWGAVFSSDGTRIITASGDNNAYIWDAISAKELLRLEGHTDGVLSASFSPDGLLALTASDTVEDNTVRLWDTRSGAVIQSFAGNDHASFSTDGTKIAVHTPERNVEIYCAVDGTKLVTLEADGTKIAFLSESRFISTMSHGKTARIFDVGTGKSLAALNDDHRFRAFSFDSARSEIVTFSEGGAIKRWDAETGEFLSALQISTREALDGLFFTASFSQDRSRLATASWNGKAQIWDTSTGKHIALAEGHAGKIIEVGFSPDGTRLVTASGDGTVRIWAVDIDLLRALIRSRTPHCLPVDFRKNELAESLDEAQQKFDACQICVPKFFDDIGDAPRSQWQIYVDAWTNYRECFNKEAGI